MMGEFMERINNFWWWSSLGVVIEGSKVNRVLNY